MMWNEGFNGIKDNLSKCENDQRKLVQAEITISLIDMAIILWTHLFPVLWLFGSLLWKGVGETTSPEGQHDLWDQQSLQRRFPCHVGEDFKMV